MDLSLPVAFSGDMVQEVLVTNRLVEVVGGSRTELIKVVTSSLAIPVYASVLSLLVFHGVAAWGWYKNKASKNSSASHAFDERGVVEASGGATIYACRVVRLVACLTLLGMEMWGLFYYKDVAAWDERVLEFGLCGVYAYTSILSLLSITVTTGLSQTAIRHLCFVLVVTWAVFVYRDVYPLATFTIPPADSSDGAILWVYIGVMTVAAVIVPLCIPREYVPVDPKHPSEEVNPEQTVSILSRLIYTYVDPLIIKANRVAHLPLDEFPPSPDYDEAKNLITPSLAHLDEFSAKKRHIVFGLFSVFRVEYTAMVFTTLLIVALSAASPIGVNRLLNYIETEGQDAIVRPWFWILWLFMGPMCSALASQFHQFLLNCVTVRAGAIITELVLEHALRVRVKSETAQEPTSDPTTAVPTPDTASLADPSGSSEPSSEAAGDSSTKKQSEPSISGASISTKVSEEPQPRGGDFLGRLNNLVTTDLNNISEGADIFMLVLYVPVQLAFCVIFLYNVLGWSAFVGIAATIACFPIPGYLSKLLSGTQKLKMKKTDARVQNVTETMGIIRMVKMFGWETKMSDRIAKTREEELLYIRRYKMLSTLTGISGFIIPFVTSITTYATYSLIMKKGLTASIVFSSMVVFDMFRGQLWSVSSRLPATIAAKVSLDRLTAFLYETELLDEFAPDFVDSYNNPEVEPHAIGFKDASFAWDSSTSGTDTPGSSRRRFRLRIEDELFFKRGQINLIVGPTGCGKTSLLMALLGEMHYIPLGPDSYYNLPRDGGIAYASQESWVQNETIRDNILFGAEYEEERYTKAIEQCGLKRDLDLFEAGDMTEVGEKGLTLSGGQKARVTLARAVYSKAEILLLDDVLAALDVHTAKWIVEKCLKGDLIQGRTVILITHNIALTRPVAEFVVALDRNGRVSSSGSLSKVLAKDVQLSTELETEEKELAKVDSEIDNQVMAVDPNKSTKGKLVVAEEVAVGRVGWPAVKLFFASLGGRNWVLWWGVFAFNMTFTPFTETFATWYLGYWARQYEQRPSSEVSAAYYVTTYTLIVVVSCILNTLGYLYFIYGAVRASRIIHQKLIASILGSTMRWLDVTPTSRVINRCTQDVSAVDGLIPNLFQAAIEVTTFMLTRFFAVLLVAPGAVLPGILVGVASGICGHLYLRAQLSIKREMSNAQSPILSHFGAAMTGLISIRAYGAQSATKLESYARINRFTRASRTFKDVNRWMSVRVEAIGALFAAGIAAYLVYGVGVSASSTGFTINMAVGFCELVRWWIYAASRIEVQANSLERIHQYLTIDHEPEATSDGVPPAYWPSSGKLSVEKLSARYSADGPKVLHDLNFTVNSGERVGIVGRTGSGKSSLTLALLRCILTDGSVTFDDLPTGSVNLDALRSNITIIPQVPELLSGSLRQNLDPFDEYDDAVLNDSLRAAGLFSLQNEEDDSRLTLDSPIASGGSNLSVGQRQILALARAMVRRSKLLILDEATSAIDNDTDNVIQASLRNELPKDVTLLTIAHRLQTIMDADKIMVLDAGHIVEFGAPWHLLKNDQGVLRALVDESGDKDNLLGMVVKRD